MIWPHNKDFKKQPVTQKEKSAGFRLRTATLVCLIRAEWSCRWHVQQSR